MDSINDLIKSKGEESPILRGAKAALTVEEANRIIINLFGPDSKNYVEAVYLQNGVLGVLVRGTAAASEIKLNQDKILAEICNKFGADSVKKIRFLI